MVEAQPACYCAPLQGGLEVRTVVLRLRFIPLPGIATGSPLSHWFESLQNKKAKQDGKARIMHEVSLGGVIRDYLTGEARERTTYEDLRQALARYLVEERGYDPAVLIPRYPVHYAVGGETLTREADIAMLLGSGSPGMLLVFCAGQIHSYVREVQALARLAVPGPCPLGVVTDMREIELFAAKDRAILARGLYAFPDQATMESLALEHSIAPLTDEQREKESRILHAYTGFLKTCCGESCSF